jgi:hypothetical protein
MIKQGPAVARGGSSHQLEATSFVPLIVRLSAQLPDWRISVRCYLVLLRYCGAVLMLVQVLGPGSSKGIQNLLKGQFFANFLRFSFLYGHSFCFPARQSCAKHCATARNYSIQQGQRKARRGNLKPALQRDVLAFFSTIATCAMRNKQELLMMMLFDDCNDGTAISGICALMG